MKNYIYILPVVATSLCWGCEVDDGDKPYIDDTTPGRYIATTTIETIEDQLDIFDMACNMDLYLNASPDEQINLENTLFRYWTIRKFGEKWSVTNSESNYYFLTNDKALDEEGSEWIVTRIRPHYYSEEPLYDSCYVRRTAEMTFSLALRNVVYFPGNDYYVSDSEIAVTVSESNLEVMREFLLSGSGAFSSERAYDSSNGTVQLEWTLENAVAAPSYRKPGMTKANLEIRSHTEQQPTPDITEAEVYKDVYIMISTSFNGKDEGSYYFDR